MKAIELKKAGSIDNMAITDISQPIIKDNEVLVEVRAISVNPVDVKARGIEELLTMICGDARPVVLGWDIAGTVVAVGTEVTKLKKGDKVFGMVNFPGVGNAYAECVAAPETQLAKMPENVTFEEAAATTLAALTALQVLQTRVKAGDKVLIHAGSGGVGHFAIQIAKHLGAYVTTTCSSKNRDFVLSLGADEHIDYRTQKFEEILSDIDFVLDTFNGETLLNSVKVVKAGGAIISLPTPEFSEEITQLAKQRNINVSFLMVQSDSEDMNTLKELLKKEIIKPHIYKTFSFADMAQAHLQVESGRTVGKVIVTI